MRLLFLCFALLLASPARALDTIYLIRHAEKEPAWPEERELSSMTPLTAEGLQRAGRWADHLAESGVVAVYASATTRSLHTGLPLSERLQIPLAADTRTVRAEQVSEFLEEMKETHAEAQAILVVGHSNTVPFFLEAAGVPEDCMADLGVFEHSYGPGIEGNDGLWTLHLNAEGCARASVERLP